LGQKNAGIPGEAGGGRFGFVEAETGGVDLFQDDDLGSLPL
jgi:hypothetical protein